MRNVPALHLSNEETRDALGRLRPAGVTAFGGKEHLTRGAQADAEIQALFDCMPQLGWAARPDGWIYYYNKQWYEFTGTTLEQMQGWNWQSVHNPQTLPMVLKRWAQSISTGQPFEMAFQLRRHDGVFRWFLTRVAPMHDAHGEIDRWVGINTDIDDQKQAEEAAAEASQAKDDFLAMLGHELRNPLAPIVTALHLMQVKGDESFASERAIITRQTDHLSRLVDDLLDVSQFLHGRMRICLETIDLEQVIRQACEMVAPLIERQQHQLEVQVAPGLTMTADPARLKQALVNLLNNAAKYTPERGSILIAAQVELSRVSIRVRDSGLGIPKALMPSLFQPFVQRRQTLARSEGGLGLGLAIADAIVAAHHGSINAFSGGEMRGSEFTLRLPHRSLKPAETAPVEPTLVHEFTARRILIVDDNLDAATLLAAALEERGHVVHVAYDAESALAKSETFGPEIGLLDLGLPGMDGYELARRFSNHLQHREMRLIAITGYGQLSDRERTKVAGFDDHLVKPVDVDELLEAIEQSCASQLSPNAPSTRGTVIDE